MSQLTYKPFIQGHDIIFKDEAFQAPEIQELNPDEQSLFRFLLFFASDYGVIGCPYEIARMDENTPVCALKSLAAHDLITLMPSGTCLIHNYDKYVDTGRSEEPDDLMLVERM